ncbi:hypothetical protein KIPB_011433, partial [Kipferlia bialata]|eukprot:g11433.t1
MGGPDSMVTPDEEELWTIPRILLLNSSMAGLQFAFAISSSFVIPYLEQILGFSAATANFIVLAGPLCGFLVMPIVGLLSDKHTGKYGRRRPFILVGAISLCISLLMFGLSGPITDDVTISKVMAVTGVVCINVN